MSERTQLCDFNFAICSRTFFSTSRNAWKRIGLLDGIPALASIVACSSSSLAFISPQSV